jgi:hypothetical protein
VADKRCDNGHFIDESWDICPYCPQDASEPEIPVVRPRAVEVAAAPPAPSVPSSVSGGAAAAPAAGRFEETGGRGGHRSTGTGSGSLSAVAIPPMERTVAASRLDTQKRYVVGWLVGLSGAARGESFPVRMGRNIIGRDRKSDIVINDDQASSHHADLVFRPEEKRFILMDHNSTNGTYVNETEIEPRRDLMPQDVIRIGSQRFIFTPLCHDGCHWDDEGPLK